MLRFIVAAVVGYLLFVSQASAQTNPPPFSMQRVGVGVSSGIQTYGAEDGVNSTAGFYRLALAYSTGKQLSVGGALQRDFTNSLNTAEIGPRLLVAGTGQGDKGQLALGANWVHYDNGGPGIEKNSSWNAGLYSSYNVANGANKPVRWYGVGNAVYDQNNNRFNAQLGLLLAWSPYKAR